MLWPQSLTNWGFFASKSKLTEHKQMICPPEGSLVGLRVAQITGWCHTPQMEEPRFSFIKVHYIRPALSSLKLSSSQMFRLGKTLNGLNPLCSLFSLYSLSLLRSCCSLLILFAQFKNIIPTNWKLIMPNLGQAFVRPCGSYPFWASPM